MRLHKNIFEQKGFYRLEYIDYPKKKNRKNNKRTSKQQTNTKIGKMGREWDRCLMPRKGIEEPRK